MLYIQSLLSDRTYQSLFLPKLLKVSLTLLYFGIYSNEYKGLILLVLLECCSIFKVLPAGSLADSFVIISNSFALVNRFFKIYFTFLLSVLKCVSHRQKARIAYRKMQMPE